MSTPSRPALWSAVHVALGRVRHAQECHLPAMAAARDAIGAAESVGDHATRAHCARTFRSHYAPIEAEKVCLEMALAKALAADAPRRALANRVIPLSDPCWNWR